MNNTALVSKTMSFPSVRGITKRIIEKRTIVSALEQQAAKQPNNTMLIFEGRSLTWREFNEEANQYAHAFLELGLKKGDTVALMMENRIEFLSVLIGLSKIGVVAGLINHNLSGNPLVHCIKEINAKKVIYGEEVTHVIAEIKPSIAADFIFVGDKKHLESPSWSIDIAKGVNGFPTGNPEQSSQLRANDLCCYIYTSGTTGLPKASILRHDRWFKAGFGFGKFALRTKKSDRYYLCTPLFHSSALFIGVGSAVVCGASIFLRRKFSASNFLVEAREHKTNTFIYIGELCRYLLHTPVKPDDADNPITKCAGNGLRPDIWQEFKARFGITRVGEFYASTEGNIAFMNCFNNDSTIGFSPAKFSLIKYDVDNDQVVKDRNGYCVKVETGEPGLLVAKINEMLPFEGYTNREASEKKVMRNVFKAGDAYFNSGDLIKRVPVKRSFGMAHYQFVDRVGDTFRWKGENVSTNEVESILNSDAQIKYSNVFGVELPGTNGRAGMAALILEKDVIDFEQLSSHINQELPSYARPVFLRILKDMDTTGTFKLLKGDLKKQGYHPDLCPEPIYVKKPGDEEYIALSPEFYAEIIGAKAGY